MISTYEGTIENGQIRIKGNVSLPDKAKVYVVIPELETTPKAQIKTSRLGNPIQTGDFVKQVFETTKEKALIRLDQMRAADAHLQKSNSIDLIREDRNR